MLKTFTRVFLYFLISDFFLFAQHQPKIISGEETEASSIRSGINPQKIIFEDRTISGSNYIFTIHNITDMATGYDLQSNGSPQQVWYDINNGSLNAVFMTSQEEAGWWDRTSTYFYSSDGGVTWINVGNIPPSPPPAGSRSGFPVIHGLSSGSIVISNHSNLDGTGDRPRLFISSIAGMYNFIEYDPGNNLSLPLYWPRLIVSNNNIIFAASTYDTPPVTNTFNLSSTTFSGYMAYDGEIAETYAFGISNEGKIGHAFIDLMGGAWYRESNDEGLTWSVPVQIFQPFLDPIDSLAHSTFRGINISYIGETPKVVFEVVRKTPDLFNFFPDLPSQIHFWSPDLNNSQSFIIADSNNVPYYPNQGVLDLFTPICRPVIGKSQGDNELYVAFTAATENIAVTLDSSRFYGGYFMKSQDGGITWTNPEKFTPSTTPHLDWRWVSIAPINPDFITNRKVHLVIVGDPIAGSQVLGAPVGVTAKFYHISTEIIIPVELVSFQASSKDNDVILEWITATELNNFGFEVQRNFNNEFRTIRFINGHGTTTEIKSYTYIDKNIQPGIYRYRLKQIDFDGTYEYYPAGATGSNFIEVDVSGPFEYQLDQNYPNPFNPATRIRYQIPETGKVTLKIYDILGREVTTLVNEEKTAGSYEVVFDAAQFASGVYFYKLQAGSYSSFKKMIVIR